MKQIFTLLFMLSTCCSLKAQKNITFNIVHNLGTEPFIETLAGVNDLGDTYKIDRLEYYISQIALVHDGGQVTPVEDYWILVSAKGVSTYDLGMMDVTDLESISFYIGVEPEWNHADPALWPADHPLAPKSPSMHWGWAGGYRFIALEGNGGPSFNQNFELHSVDNDNYFEITVDLAPVTTDDEIVFNVNADYNEALRGISVNSGVISHGTPESVVCIENFRDYVFSTGNTTGIMDVQNSLDFNVSPNPSLDGMINISFEDSDQDHQIQVYDLSGKLFLKQMAQSSSAQINLEKKGIYLVNIIDSKGNQGTKRVIVQ